MSEQFVATRGEDQRAVLAAVPGGSGLALVEGRLPYVHLYAQNDGREGLAFYDRRGALRVDPFVRADGTGALTFDGPNGEQLYRVPEEPGGPVVTTMTQSMPFAPLP